MNVRKSLLALLVLPAVSGCWPRPADIDPDPVAQRYALRYGGDCSSWLVSHKTGYRYCASPAVVVPVTAPVAAVAAAAPAAQVTDGPTDPESLRAHGEKVYGTVCAACHQANGQGLPGAFPPLAGAGGFYGDPQNHARIIVHGLTGEIEVAGQKFNGAMPPQGAALSDYEVAAVATYERSSWGNADGPVMPADVAAVRSP